MKNLLLTIAVTAGLSGCTAVKVESLSATSVPDKVCIKNNPLVTVPDFVKVIQEGFDRNGIYTEIINNSRSGDCTYTLTYSALRSWDMATYLSQAELRIFKDNKQIAFAEYHLRGKGGLALNKWASIKSKMDPVIDKLLENHKISSQ